MIAQLRIHQILIDLLPPHVSPLRHFSQSARQVHDGVAAVVLGEEEHGEVFALCLVAVRGCGWG